MSRAPLHLRTVLLCPCLLAAPLACVGPEPDQSEPAPQSPSAWQTVFDGQIAVSIEGGNDPRNVRAFTIGGKTVDDNFANRGDVEVYYTLDPVNDNGTGDMVVQMRPFAGSLDSLEEGLDAVQPWIWKGALERPDLKDPETEACDARNGFTAGCNIRVWYDGLSQPVRSGAHLGVFLPSNYRGQVNIVTEDDIWPDGNYLGRSDVTIAGLYGSADVELEAGEVAVSLARDVMTAPGCGDTDALARQANDLCAAYVDPLDDEPSPWDPKCGCADAFGRVIVSSTEPAPANIIVDAPSDLWTRANALNLAPNDAVTRGCTGEVVCGDFASCTPVECGEEARGSCLAYLNEPAGAPKGAGYVLQLTSAACGEVSVHDDPFEAGSPPRSVLRGNIEVCSDCLDLDLPTPR